MIRHRSVIGVTISALLALAGCSASGSTVRGPAEPAIGAIPIVLTSLNLRLPVDDYLPTPDQNDRIGRAQLILIRRCMARFGFDYAVNPLPSSQYGPRSLTDRRYGIADAELARTAGYGLGPRDPALLPRPTKPQLGPDGENVLSGQGRSEVNGLPVPDGGCIAEADRVLDRLVPVGADATKGSELQFRSFEQSKKDSRVRAAFMAWSSCMNESGYHYGDPLAAAADPAFMSPPSPEQLAVAARDIDCKARTNLIGLWFTVESAYQREAIATDDSGFAAAREAIAARDHAAAAIGQL